MRHLVACLVGCAALAAPALAQTAAPCEPSAVCAVRAARAAAFARYPRATTERDRDAMMTVLYWAAARDTAQDPAALGSKFAAVRARIEQLPAGAERQKALAQLARTLAESGLVDDAVAIATTFKNQNEKDFVQAGLASGYARRGRVREAMAALDQIPAGTLSRKLAAGAMLNDLAALGRPELVREMAPLMKDPRADPALIGALVAFAEQAAGRHDAARAAAMRIADTPSRIVTLRQLLKKYEDKAQYAEALATARLFVVECHALEVDAELADRLKAECATMFVDSLSNAKALGEELEWLPKLAADERGRRLENLAPWLSKPADIRQAEKLARELPPEQRAKVLRGIAVSRVRVGEISVDAALRQADEPWEMSGYFAGLASELGDGQRARALEVLTATVASMPQPGVESAWKSVAYAQIDLGLFDDARKTIAQFEPGAQDRLLMCLSAAQSQLGMKAEAQRSLSEAVQIVRGHEGIEQYPDSVALTMAQCKLFDEAAAELRRLVAARTDPKKLRTAAGILLLELVRANRLALAFDLANMLSKHAGDDPEPFTSIYANLARDDSPQDLPMPRVDPFEPIKADIVDESDSK